MNNIVKVAAWVCCSLITGWCLYCTGNLLCLALMCLPLMAEE